jgi:hypothetical protein
MINIRYVNLHAIIGRYLLYLRIKFEITPSDGNMAWTCTGRFHRCERSLCYITRHKDYVYFSHTSVTHTDDHIIRRTGRIKQTQPHSELAPECHSTFDKYGYVKCTFMQNIRLCVKCFTPYFMKIWTSKTRIWNSARLHISRNLYYDSACRTTVQIRLTYY